MAKRKITKQSKRRLMILIPISIIAIVSCIFTVANMGYNLYTLHNEQKKLENDLVELQKDAKELKTEITKLQDKDYVARYARENYLYTKDGEYVIKVDEEEEKKEKNKNEIEEKHVYYVAGALSLLIVLYIIFKHRKSKKKKPTRK